LNNYRRADEGIMSNNHGYGWRSVPRNRHQRSKQIILEINMVKSQGKCVKKLFPKNRKGTKKYIILVLEKYSRKNTVWELLTVEEVPWGNYRCKTTPKKLSWKVTIKK
jgi:hypothetical protein